MSKKIGKPHFNNCWLPIIYLAFKGKLAGFIWARPFHIIGITKNGNYVHFSSTNQYDELRPLYFQGQIKVIKQFPIKKPHWRFGNGYKYYSTN
jgi:hypothetical protein